MQTENFDRYQWQKEPIIEKKKLTFDEWYEKVIEVDEKFPPKYIAEWIWDVAQENAK